MNIKKIVAPTMPEAMKKVKAEMGDNAVILNSKIIYSGGFLGLFRKKNIEVIAALDETMPNPIITKKNPNRRMVGNDKTAFEQITKPNQENLAVVEEIRKLKSDMQLLKTQQSLEIAQYPEQIQACLQLLLQQDFKEEYALQIGDALLQKWRNHQHEPSTSEIIEWCHMEIIRELNQIGFSGIPDDVKFISFVGPTGVGKTTTIAKLAAESVLVDKKKTALITTDTYRIAAIEQLKTYADLLNIPLEIVYGEQDLLNATKKYSEFDRVFIDTAGRNYREKQFITELKALFGTDFKMLTYLVLSISMKEQDIEKIIENFQDMNINKFVFSKADETESYGIMYNLMKKYQIGAAYITTGQDVPDDICLATAPLITDYFFRNESP